MAIVAEVGQTDARKIVLSEGDVWLPPGFRPSLSQPSLICENTMTIARMNVVSSSPADVGDTALNGGTGSFREVSKQAAEPLTGSAMGDPYRTGHPWFSSKAAASRH